jgi:hypothetical protein
MFLSNFSKRRKDLDDRYKGVHNDKPHTKRSTLPGNRPQIRCEVSDC